MPIYAYRCSACGHSKDVLQKMSDPVLHTCPVCAAESFTKQVTAAGFQLKGSGWYATDFKGSGAAPAASASSKDGKDGEGKSASSDQAAAAPAADKPAASTPSPAAASPGVASVGKSSGAPAAPAP